VSALAVSVWPNHSLAGGGPDKMKVAVSIAPQKYFVGRIGGEKVEVLVMVPPGFSPATYDPLPRQMARLAEAVLYFRIGVPFEDSWLGGIESTNPRMKVVDTRKGIELAKMRDFEGLRKLMSEAARGSQVPFGAETAAHVEPSSERARVPDPHIWLSPRLVKTQAENIARALIEADPRNEDFYRANLDSFLEELDELSRGIGEMLSGISVRMFLVFHPAWGYFAQEFGLTEVPIEIEGKEPTARQLVAIIDFAKKMHIRTVFVQPQFSSRMARTVARAIGAEVVAIDPMAEDYPANLMRVASIMRDRLADKGGVR